MGIFKLVSDVKESSVLSEACSITESSVDPVELSVVDEGEDDESPGDACELSSD